MTQENLLHFHLNLIFVILGIQYYLFLMVNLHHHWNLHVIMIALIINLDYHFLYLFFIVQLMVFYSIFIRIVCHGRNFTPLFQLHYRILLRLFTQLRQHFYQLNLNLYLQLFFSFSNCAYFRQYDFLEWLNFLLNLIKISLHQQYQFIILEFLFIILDFHHHYLTRVQNHLSFLQFILLMIFYSIFIRIVCHGRIFPLLFQHHYLILLRPLTLLRQHFNQLNLDLYLQ